MPERCWRGVGAGLEGSKAETLIEALCDELGSQQWIRKGCTGSGIMNLRGGGMRGRIDWHAEGLGQGDGGIGVTRSASDGQMPVTASAHCQWRWIVAYRASNCCTTECRGRVK